MNNYIFCVFVGQQMQHTLLNFQIVISSQWNVAADGWFLCNNQILKVVWLPSIFKHSVAALVISLIVSFLMLPFIKNSRPLHH